MEWFPHVCQNGLERKVLLLRNIPNHKRLVLIISGQEVMYFDFLKLRAPLQNNNFFVSYLITKGKKKVKISVNDQLQLESQPTF